MALTLMDVSNDNKGPTTAQHYHNDRSNATICYNPVNRMRQFHVKIHSIVWNEMNDEIRTWRIDI